MATATKKPRDPGRGVSEALAYALGSWIRAEIISLLLERPHNQKELCRALGLGQSKVQHHIGELLKQGSIDEREGGRRGNLVEKEYVAVRKVEYSAEDYEDMDTETARMHVGMTLQNALAEHLTAFRLGAMRGEDPHLALLWDWFDVDEQGRDELTSEAARSWARYTEIRADSDKRREGTKKPGHTVVVSLIAHRRVRPSPTEKAFRKMVAGKGVSTDPTQGTSEN